MSSCDTCVEITLTAEAMGEENIRLKRTNKILRTVNGMLRRQFQRQQTSADEVFVSLCDVDKGAELAMGELWGSGEFDCGPQDYDFIVERCLAAIRDDESRTKPCTGLPCSSDPHWQQP